MDLTTGTISEKEPEAIRCIPSNEDGCLCTSPLWVCFHSVNVAPQAVHASPLEWIWWHSAATAVLKRLRQDGTASSRLPWAAQQVPGQPWIFRALTDANKPTPILMQRKTPSKAMLKNCGQHPVNIWQFCLYLIFFFFLHLLILGGGCAPQHAHGAGSLLPSGGFWRLNSDQAWCQAPSCTKPISLDLLWLS